MPTACQYGGAWTTPAGKSNQFRPCSLLDSISGVTGVAVKDEKCQACSGADDGTSYVSNRITAYLGQRICTAWNQPDGGSAWTISLQQAVTTLAQRNAALCQGALVTAQANGLDAATAASLAQAAGLPPAAGG